MTSDQYGLSFSTRKALSVQLGESASEEIASLLHRMAMQIEELKRSKVSVTPVVPGAVKEVSPLHSIDNETF